MARGNFKMPFPGATSDPRPKGPLEGNERTEALHDQSYIRHGCTSRSGAEPRTSRVCCSESPLSMDSWKLTPVPRAFAWHRIDEGPGSSVGRFDMKESLPHFGESNRLHSWDFFNTMMSTYSPLIKLQSDGVEKQDFLVDGLSRP
jgi:hypothetical protein